MKKRRRKKQSAKPEVVDRFAGLTPKEKRRAIGRLGGIARAKNLSAEQRKRISSKGGLVTSLRHGAEFYSQLTKARWEARTDEERAAECERLAKISRARSKKKQKENKRKAP